MIPTPVSTYGRYVPPNTTRQVVYDGTSIPYFLRKHGGNPHHLRQFLWHNRIGDPFALPRGRAVQVQVATTALKSHSEA